MNTPPPSKTSTSAGVAISHDSQARGVLSPYNELEESSFGQRGPFSVTFHPPRSQKDRGFQNLRAREVNPCPQNETWVLGTDDRPKVG